MADIVKKTMMQQMAINKLVQHFSEQSQEISKTICQTCKSGDVGQLQIKLQYLIDEFIDNLSQYQTKGLNQSIFVNNPQELNIGCSQCEKLSQVQQQMKETQLKLEILAEDNVKLKQTQDDFDQERVWLINEHQKVFDQQQLEIKKLKQQLENANMGLAIQLHEIQEQEINNEIVLVWNCPDCPGSLSELDQTCAKCGLNIQYFEETKKVDFNSMLLETKRQALIDSRKINAPKIVPQPEVRIQPVEEGVLQAFQNLVNEEEAKEEQVKEEQA